MKIWADNLTTDDLYATLPDGVYLEHVEIKNPRKRARGWDVHLTTDHGRYANSGQWGASHEKAASWDEWGVWIARLFEIDPGAAMTYYTGRDDFYAKTAQHVPTGMKAPWLKVTA